MQPEIEFRDDYIHVELPHGFEFDPNGSAVVWQELKRLCEEHDTARKHDEKDVGSAGYGLGQAATFRSHSRTAAQPRPGNGRK